MNSSTIYNEVLEAFGAWLEDKYPGRVDGIHSSIAALLDNDYAIDQLKALDDIVYKEMGITKGMRKCLKDNCSEYMRNRREAKEKHTQALPTTHTVPTAQALPTT